MTLLIQLGLSLSVCSERTLSRPFISLFSTASRCFMRPAKWHFYRLVMLCDFWPTKPENGRHRKADKAVCWWPKKGDKIIFMRQKWRNKSQQHHQGSRSEWYDWHHNCNSNKNPTERKMQHICWPIEPLFEWRKRNIVSSWFQLNQSDFDGIIINNNMFLVWHHRVLHTELQRDVHLKASVRFEPTVTVTADSSSSSFFFFLSSCQSVSPSQRSEMSTRLPLWHTRLY